MGLFRPITLFPFPEKEIALACCKAKQVLTVEMSMGQMIEDVRLALNCRVPVSFYGRVGVMVPSTRAIYNQLTSLNARGGQQ